METQRPLEVLLVTGPRGPICKHAVRAGGQRSALSELGVVPSGHAESGVVC